MNKTQNTIIIIAILLVFLFYQGKKKAKYGCVDVWKNISNPSAQQIWTESYNMVENNNDIQAEIFEYCKNNNYSEAQCKKHECLYVTDYMLQNNVINLNEKDKIRKCICDNIT
tara:strand:- start:764 stop:1102 length:339 start_codon:yes stop_codon:yes gene_type:complete